MHLSYLELTLLVLITLSIGGLFVYFLLNNRVKALKESIRSLDASLKGMWDNSDAWQKKYAALEKKQQLGTPEKLEEHSLAKHASDDSVELQEHIS